MSTESSPCPFAEGADAYWTAGWPVIPVIGKFPPEPGYTGWNGAVASYPDIQAWKDGPQGKRNIALRLPAGVLGIDKDAYKGGDTTMKERELEWGDLPPTWSTTSRDDGSGIFLFKVPPGLSWPGQVGPSVETVHFGHRYAMVWPSIHPSGKTYRWIRPDGVVSLTVPKPDDLTTLPAGWVIGLMRGIASPDAKVDVDQAEAAEWIQATSAPGVAPCGPLVIERNRTLDALASGGSRHEAARDGVMALVRSADQGHVGLATALDQVRSDFLARVSTDRSGAAAEWSRIVMGAIAIVQASPSDRARRGPCLPPVPSAHTVLEPVLPATDGTAALVLSYDPDVSAGAPLVDMEAVHLMVHGPERVWRPGIQTSIHVQAEAATVDGPPTELRRLDGTALFYPGRINGVLGPSESGKTWIVLEAVRQALVAGRRVVYYDFEDTAAGIRGRLRLMGLEDDQMNESHLIYLSPDVPPQPGELEEAVADLVAFEPCLTVLDGVNAAMTIMGLDLTNNKDATTFFQRVLRPFCDSGAAVVYIDHVPKNTLLETKGGIGAQAKRAMTTGTALRIDVIDQFSRGHAGSLGVYVDKDRNGFVRQRSKDARDVGIARIVPEDGGQRIAVSIIYDPEAMAREGTPEDRLRIQICTFIGNQPASRRPSIRAVERAVEGRAEVIREAVKWLMVNGFVADESGGRRQSALIVLRPYEIGQESASQVRPGVRPGASLESAVSLGRCVPPGGHGPEGPIPLGRTASDPEVDHEKLEVQDELPGLTDPDADPGQE